MDFLDPGRSDPENRVEDEFLECRPGDPFGDNTGVEWNELVVFSPSWESRDGL